MAGLKGATLVAVSKTQPLESITELYQLGQRDMGENYVQELVDKYNALPKDIRWHFIGHLQRNKVKYIAPFVHLVQGVDSLRLLKEIDKEAEKNNRVIDCLLQVHIAREETKFGLDEKELDDIINGQHLPAMKHIHIKGLMGMASFDAGEEVVKNEFRYLATLFNNYRPHSHSNLNMQWLSMGMSSDYAIALEEGSNMIRVGSMIFGKRNYNG